MSKGATAMVTVELKSLKKDYDLGKTKVRALKGINLTIDKGEFIAVAGPSGSGKSTLLNLIGCLDYPTAGEVWIDGVLVSSLGEGKLNKIRLHTIGFIFQSFNLIPVLNVYENIELPLLIRRDVSASERKKRVTTLIEAVGLADQRTQRPAELSGGQRQRVAVARALVTKPAIVLADEPTANLDSKTGIEVIELMHSINKQHDTSFVFSTHDPKIIQRANMVHYLEDGRFKKEYSS
jgi:putative ABC transport system ATP-binding protein